VLVVSKIGLRNLDTMEPSLFLKSSIKEATINLNNDYRYLKTGYYVSLHAEVLGNQVIPSCEDIIDSSRTPILLLRATRANIASSKFMVTDSVKKIIDELGLPVIIFAVNPFIHTGYKIAANKSALYRALKSLGMNYKFDVCAMPLKGEVVSFKSFFGKAQSSHSEVAELSQKVYDLFKIPICRLHTQIIDGVAYLCGLEPIEEKELSKEDLVKIEQEILLISQQGEHVSV
jgi:hypothetical protein